MKFGSVPVRDALDGVLAHTHRLSGSRGAQERAPALGAGYSALGRCRRRVGRRRAARPRRRSRRRGGRNVSPKRRPGWASAPERPRPARCNLYAKHRGLLVFDRARVDAANLVDESLTIGTLANHAVVEVGAMVATVKVIPFAVAAPLVDRCLGAMTALFEGRAVRCATRGPGAHHASRGPRQAAGAGGGSATGTGCLLGR